MALTCGYSWGQPLLTGLDVISCDNL